MTPGSGSSGLHNSKLIVESPVRGPVRQGRCSVPLVLASQFFVQDTLSEPVAFRGNLEEFVLFDVFESLLDRHDPRGTQEDVLVAAGGADIGQLFFRDTG